MLNQVADDLHERYIKWEFEPRASVVAPAEYHDAFVTDQAIDFVAKQPADKSLCLVASLHSTHPPLDASGEYATMYDPQSLKLPANLPELFIREMHEIEPAEVRRMPANYLGKISPADAQVGKLVDAMKKRGTWENTFSSSPPTMAK